MPPPWPLSPPDLPFLMTSFSNVAAAKTSNTRSSALPPIVALPFPGWTIRRRLFVMSRSPVMAPPSSVPGIVSL